MSIDLIIDGYNLMHFAGLVRTSFGPGGFERARNSLLKRLQKCLTVEELARTTIVFDGTHTNLRKQTVTEEFGIEVIYSPQGVEADDVIEELILRHNSPKQLMIISSDNRLYKAARKRRAGLVDSETFVEELERREEISHEEHRRATSKTSLKQSSTLSEDDLEEWLGIFEDVDPAQIAAEMKSETKPTLPSASHAQTGPSKKKSLLKPARTETSHVQNTSPINIETDTEKDADNLSNDPLINDVNFWQQRIDEMYREEKE